MTTQEPGIAEHEPVLTAASLEDWQLERAHSRSAQSSAAARSAEELALDGIPDASVTDALRQLPGDFRMAVYLAHVEGFGYREIGQVMHCPIGTVMSRLHRGRGRLRELLENDSERV
jgi:RNA polymerase sigma-70 factor, ECF subfamily